MSDESKKIIETEYPPICKYCGMEIETPTAAYNSKNKTLYHPPGYRCVEEEYKKNGKRWEDEDTLEVVELKVNFNKLPEKVRFDLRPDGNFFGKRKYVEIFGGRYYRALRLVPQSENHTPLEERDCDIITFRIPEGTKTYDVYQLVKILDEEYPVIWGSFIEVDRETVLKLKRAAKNSKPRGNKKVK